MEPEAIAQAVREQPVRLGPSKENQGRDHIGILVENTLVRLHERTDDEGVRAESLAPCHITRSSLVFKLAILLVAQV